MKFHKGARILAALIFFFLLSSVSNGAEEMLTIGSGKVVTMNVILTVEGKEVFSTHGRDPLTFTQGSGKIVPGLEKGLEGMKAGEEKDIDVSAAEGYGAVDEKAFIEFPKAKLPAGEITPGAIINLAAPDGKRVPAVIHEIKQDSVILDLNHPLAGKQLHFKVSVVSVK